MPPHVLADACGDRGAFEVRLRDLLLVMWLAPDWIDKQPVFGRSKKRLAAPSQKDFHEPWIARNMVARVFEFAATTGRRMDGAYLYRAPDILRTVLDQMHAAGSELRRSSRCSEP